MPSYTGGMQFNGPAGPQLVRAQNEDFNNRVNQYQEDPFHPMSGPLPDLHWEALLDSLKGAGKVTGGAGLPTDTDLFASPTNFEAGQTPIKRNMATGEDYYDSMGMPQSVAALGRAIGKRGR